MTAANVPFSSASQSNYQALEVEKELGYGQLFSVLLRRKFWVLASAVSAVALATVYTLRQEPTYVSSMQLLVESNYQSKRSTPFEGEVVDGNVQIDAATQLSLMQSSKLMKRAMTLLSSTYPDLNPDSPQAVYNFRQSLTLGQLGDDEKGQTTKIFQVDYMDADPQRTQHVLQALQQVYQEYNLEQQQERLEKGLSFINEQIPDARRNVDSAESALERFRIEQGIIDPELQAQTHLSMISSLEQELRANEAQLQELNRRYSGLLEQIGMAPEQAVIASRLSQSSRYQTLLNQIQETELQLVQQQLRYTTVTPQIQQIQEQRQRQLQLLTREASRVLRGNSVAKSDPESFLFQGQLSPSEIEAINQLVSSRINLDASVSRQQSLLRARQILEAEISRFPELLAEYGRLLPEISTSRETLQLLLRAQQDLGLEIARGGFDWQVVEEPLYGFQTGPDHRRNLLLGAVAGLMVGGMAAFGREALDDLVHTSDDLQKQVPVPLLGMVPVIRVEGSEFGRTSRLKMEDEAQLAPALQSILRWQGFREAMDLIYQNIQIVNATKSLRSLVVTSSLAGEGKSTLSLGLAFSAARLHRRVLLIDADLRRPSLHKLMNLPNREGLSTILQEGEIPPHLLPLAEEAGRTGVSVLTAGPSPADPAKLLSSRRMVELIETFEEHYDLVIVDTPPASGMVDSILIGAQCDGVLMVGRMDRLSKTELTQTLENLRHLNVVGVVANGVSRLRQQYAYVSDSYY